MDQLSITPQAGKEALINELFASVLPASVYGYHGSASAALTFAGYGGQIFGVTVANWTVTLTVSTTNYIVAHRTTGAVTVATTTTNWANTTTYMQLYQVVTNGTGPTATTDYRQAYGGTGGGGGTPAKVIQGAVSDETTAIATGTAKLTFRMPYAMTLTAARASLTTASTSGLPTIDIKQGGTSIFSTLLTIDATEKTSTTAATPAVISTTSLTDDAEITVDITVAGTGAAGLKIALIGT